VAPQQGVPSYVPVPAAAQQGVRSYTPLPVSARTGVPSYTPPPVRILSQQAKPAAIRETADDTTVAFMPFFAIKEAENFFEVCNLCIEKVKSEDLCLGYGFSVSAGPHQNMAFCRESFLNAEGVIAHLHNIEILFKEGLCKYGELVSLQIHGPKGELDKLREDPIMQEMGPEFYELMPGSFEVMELPMKPPPEVSRVQQPADVSRVQQPAEAQPIEPSGTSTANPGVRQQAKVLAGGIGEASGVNIMTTPKTTYGHARAPHVRLLVTCVCRISHKSFLLTHVR
jgi:hypothetical protein